jgi:hypothetical protein
MPVTLSSLYGATQTTWTLLGSVITNPSASTTTISGISTAYKSLRIEVVGVTVSANDFLALRYNNDSTGVYSYHKEYQYSSVSAGTYSNGDNQHRLNAGAQNRLNQQTIASTILENYSNASERSKFWKTTGAYLDSNVEFVFWNDYGVYRPSSASAVTSVTLFAINGSTLAGFGTNSQSGFFIYGGN